VGKSVNKAGRMMKTSASQLHLRAYQQALIDPVIMVEKVDKLA
jgi:hypothetical protein